ncbi:MAG: CehA/McbA family metallohydrolase [Acidobacteriota bacterium]
MKPRHTAILVALIVLYSVVLSEIRSAGQSRAAGDGLRWYKGNTHTHTLNSDGDSTPDEVVTWYREHNYQFLVLTDHNYLTNVDGLNALHGADEQFLVLKGEEVTDAFSGKPVHINGLNISRRVEPQHGTSVADTLQRNVDAIRQATGVPHINHPNFQWAISADDLKQVRNNKLLEIFNGHPQVNNFGGSQYASLEEMWDALLSSGKLIYGIAVDDAHHFKRPWDADASKPGRGWVVVRADRLAADAIMEALEEGRFYASTGVELDEVVQTLQQVRIHIKTEKSAGYRVQFIGKSGRLLREVQTNPAVYSIQGDEGYIRAKVIESNGKLAWTQPVLTNPQQATPTPSSTQ